MLENASEGARIGEQRRVAAAIDEGDRNAVRFEFRGVRGDHPRCGKPGGKWLRLDGGRNLVEPVELDDRIDERQQLGRRRLMI